MAPGWWGWLTPPAPELLLSLPAKAIGSALVFSDPTCAGKGFVHFFPLNKKKKKEKCLLSSWIHK